MAEKRDRIIIGGREITSGDAIDPPRTQRVSARKFLQVWYRCCHVYGRMTRDAEHAQYVGRCPRCGAKVTARIGPHGTAQRVFEARRS